LLQQINWLLLPVTAAALWGGYSRAGMLLAVVGV
jgi:hypothetical protein